MCGGKMKITIFDNGGKTFDRYTVFIDNNVFGMSNNPTSPQGFNQVIGEMGKYIDSSDIKLSKIPQCLKYAIRERCKQCRSSM